MKEKTNEQVRFISKNDLLRYHMEENGKTHPDYMLPDGTLDKKLK